MTRTDEGRLDPRHSLRRAVALVAAGALSLALVACGSAGGEAEPTSGSADQSAQAPDSTHSTDSSQNSKEPMSGFTNPVFAANFPDPQILKGSQGWIAVATNGNGMNVQVLSSDDLATWKQGQDAMPTLAKWTSSGKVWAPEAIAWPEGGMRLYYTTKAPDPQWQCLSVASSDKPEGPYVDDSAKPIVCEIDEGGSIDATPFIDAEGRRWLYWKNDGNAAGVDTWIRVQELSKDGLSLIGKPKNLMKQDLPWEGHLVEGPALVHLDGIYHLFYSANDYGSDKYAVGHAWSKSPTGPFTKDPEPVLATNDVAAGPGHCSLFEKDGQWWMVYHAWVPGEVGDEVTGRQMWLSKVSFDGTETTVEPPTVQHDQLP